MNEIASLWTCPKCGRKLVGRNMWHSCSSFTGADFLKRAGPRGRALYQKFASLIARCGPYLVSPAKTRVAFMARVRFAGVTSVSAEALTIAFSLPRPKRSSRFTKVKEVVPGWWLHRLRVTAASQLDGELLGWLKESYRLMGMQERLKRRRRDRRRAPPTPPNA